MNPEKGKQHEGIEDEMTCPDCGSKEVRVEIKEHVFEYGVGKKAVSLSANVPVEICGKCEACYMGGDAEDACHEAICKHLRVLTSGQIRDLRKLYALSQSQFGELTGLGSATVSRWERGVVIQNTAYDNYLYLLGYHENIDRLQNRHRNEDERGLPVQHGTDASFVVINDSDEWLLQREKRFELQTS